MCGTNNFGWLQMLASDTRLMLTMTGTEPFSCRPDLCEIAHQTLGTNKALLSWVASAHGQLQKIHVMIPACMKQHGFYHYYVDLAGPLVCTVYCTKLPAYIVIACHILNGTPLWIQMNAQLIARG